MPLERHTPLRRSGLQRQGKPLEPGGAVQDQTTIRWLRSGEPDPEGEPRRYNRAGALILRWKIAKRTYVERPARHPDGSIVRTMPSKRKRIDAAVVVALYEQGRSQPEIAAILECSAGAVSRVMARAGAPARPIGARARQLDPEEAVRLYVDERMGHTTVARVLGVSPQRILAALRNAGVTRPTGRPYKSRSGPSYDTVFKRMRPIVRERSGSMCEARATATCRGSATILHHRKLRAQGGDNSLENLLDVCLPCHVAIHSMGKQAYDRGLLVRSYEDPAAVAVQPGHPALGDLSTSRPRRAAGGSASGPPTPDAMFHGAGRNF